jgi:DNA-binding transcriptional ArsR family regulator
MQRAITDLQRFKAEFFRALAHPVRIRLVEELCAGKRTVTELQNALGGLQQTIVSQQLAVLRARDIVSSTKEGASVTYAVRDPLIGDLLRVARNIFKNRLADTTAMLRELHRQAR